MIASSVTHRVRTLKSWEKAVGDHDVLRSIQFYLLYFGRIDPYVVEVSGDDILVMWNTVLYEPLLHITQGVFGVPLLRGDQTIQRMMHTNDLDHVFLNGEFGLVWRLPLRD